LDRRPNRKLRADAHRKLGASRRGRGAAGADQAGHQADGKLHQNSPDQPQPAGQQPAQDRPVPPGQRGGPVEVDDSGDLGIHRSESVGTAGATLGSKTEILI